MYMYMYIVIYYVHVHVHVCYRDSGGSMQVHCHWLNRKNTLNWLAACRSSGGMQRDCGRRQGGRGRRHRWVCYTIVVSLTRSLFTLFLCFLPPPPAPGSFPCLLIPSLPYPLSLLPSLPPFLPPFLPLSLLPSLPLSPSFPPPSVPLPPPSLSLFPGQVSPT